MTNYERVLWAFDRGILGAYVPKTDTESIKKLIENHGFIYIDYGDVVKFVNVYKAKKGGKK